jgi:hypothetical protein
MTFQREMSEFYRKEGFGGYSIYGDFNGSHAGTGQAWLASDLSPFIEEHDYPKTEENIFRWRTFNLTRPRVEGTAHPYAQGRPYWHSEAASTNFSRVVYPLFGAVYYSLTGSDGVAYFVWNMHYNRHWYGKPKLLTDEVRFMDMIGDYPLQMMIRAAGRLYKSREIKPLTDVEVLKRLPKNANLKTDQVFRANGQGILTVETDHFCAAAVDHPEKIEFKKAVFNLTSDKCNGVVMELLSDKEYEITAVGQAGGDSTDKPINDFKPLTWVRGTILLKGKTVTAVEHLDDEGGQIRTVPGKGSAVDLVEGVRLYRVKVK